MPGSASRVLGFALPRRFVTGANRIGEGETGLSEAGQTSVKQTFERDLGANGTVDYRSFDSGTYDVHGNLVRQVLDVDTDGNGRIDYREIAVSEFARHGYVSGRVFESDYSADGYPDIRLTWRTTEYDPQGNPVRQTLGWDYGANGTEESEIVFSYEYDSQNHRVREIRDDDSNQDGTIDSRQTLISEYGPSGDVTLQLLEYDQPFDGVVDYRDRITIDHGLLGNLRSQRIRYDLGADGINESIHTFWFNSHDHLVEYKRDWDWDLDGVENTFEWLRTTSFDERGNPLLQTHEVDHTGEGAFEDLDHVASSYNSRGDLVSKEYQFDGGTNGTIEDRRRLTLEYDGPPHLPEARAEESTAGMPVFQAILPNPAREETSLHFHLTAASQVQLRVYDTGGRLVRVLADGQYDRGAHRIGWDGRDESRRRVPSGAYFARLKVGDRETSRIILRTR